MTASVTTKITIHAAAAAVFTYLTDLKYMHLWNPQVRQVSTRKKLKLHSQYETESTILGMRIDACNTVTKFVANQEVQIENNTGTVHYVVNFKIDQKTARSVTVTCNTTVSSESKAFFFTTPILKVLARRELQTDLHALKIAVEHKVPHDIAS